MNKAHELSWFVLLIGIAALIFLIAGPKGNPVELMFGLGILGLVIFYFLRFEFELTKEIIQKTKRGLIKLRVPRFNLIKWMRNEGWFYSGILVAIAITFLLLGLDHLGSFMSVDEPKWLNTRVPQLYESFLSTDWENTFINDKPGVLPSLLAGITHLFTNPSNYTPDTIENFYFLWRLPILLFNFLSLFLIYTFTKRLLDKNYALLTTGFIALHPIIIGISQIVNPDATLWNTSFLAFLTFFLYLSTNHKKYVIYTGLFLGLALISKYFVTIFYPVFLAVIYLEYLINKIDKEQLKRRFFDVIKIFTISILTYALLFPATWVNIQQVLKGTLGANILSSGRNIIGLAIVLIIFELWVLRGRITEYIRKKIDIGTFTLKAMGIFFISSTIYLLINLFTGYSNFDPQYYKFFVYDRGNADFLPTLASSAYVFLFTFTLPILAGFITFLILQFTKQDSTRKHQLLSLAILSSVIIFIVGAALGGFAISARYQIMLYPLYALLATLTFLSLTKYKKMVISILLIASASTAIMVSPFYLHYNNPLNVRDTTTMGGWGYGGYELVQMTKDFIDQKGIVVWSDREGFNEFSKAGIFWRGAHNPFTPEYDIDYLVLSNDGHKIFTKALKAYNAGRRYQYARIAASTPILKYYEKEPLAKFCINDNPNYCTWIVPMDKNDIL